MTDEAKKTRNSSAYKKAQTRAEAYAKDSDKLNSLITRARDKAKNTHGKLSAIWEPLMMLFRMIKAYANGSYRAIPWQSLIMIIAAVIYFVMPTDMIPDFIFTFGLIDDAALLGWTLKTFKSDIDAFKHWEAEHEK